MHEAGIVKGTQCEKIRSKGPKIARKLVILRYYWIEMEGRKPSKTENLLQIQQKMKFLFYESIKKYLLQKREGRYIIHAWYCTHRNNFWRPFRISVFSIF